MKKSLLTLLTACTAILLFSCQIAVNPSDTPDNRCGQNTEEQQILNLTSVLATKVNIRTVIENLTEDTTIVLTGQITESDIRNISTWINAGTYKINLDLSQTTGLRSIYNWGFLGCNKLLGIHIPTSVTMINPMEFADCRELTYVNFSSSTRYIGDRAFLNCDSLTQITIPASVNMIEAGAFMDCQNLTQVTFEKTTGWYETDDHHNWFSETEGNPIDVTNTATNAENMAGSVWMWMWQTDRHS